MSNDHGDAFRAAYRFATNWAALLIVALGVLALVGLTPGFMVLDDLAGATKVFVQVDITVTMAATFLAATLAGAAVRVAVEGNELHVDVIHRRLHWSIIFAVLAAVALVSAAVSVAFADKTVPALQPSSVLVVVDGNAYCGSLVLAPDGTVSVRGFPLPRATFVAAVPICPTYRTS
ncbi:hypothetical protein [Nocardia brasiliensis]|uniref:hypothetical protein n=1 Tax=Nocardia brasiliensis TaxID=37326 RepID=UPI002458EA59|nr:hypothetical protein [Nocardia brasiliensis]